MPLARSAAADGRWQLYRLLAEPGRLRLLALVSEHELTVGELAELLSDSQPNVSRQVTSLRQGGLVVDRRQGTRTFVRIVDSMVRDPVVEDAIIEGRRLCREEGRLERIFAVLQRRNERARAGFEEVDPDAFDPRPSAELPAYALAVARLTVARGTAVDVGTGDGAMLDVLAPFFTRVIAIDRSPAQLRRAERRVSFRGYDNVELLCGDIDDREVRQRVGEGADAVFATRVLHHAASPRVTMAALVALLRPGGQLLVLEYQTHDDESFRQRQADVWMGFAKDELLQFAATAGLVGAVWCEIPTGLFGGGVDGQLAWQLVRAERPSAVP